jgi:hypothetical protein
MGVLFEVGEAGIQQSELSQPAIGSRCRRWRSVDA